MDSPFICRVEGVLFPQYVASSFFFGQNSAVVDLVGG